MIRPLGLLLLFEQQTNVGGCEINMKEISYMYPDFPIERLNVLAKDISNWIFDDANVCPSDITMMAENHDYSVLASKIMDELHTQVCGEMLNRCIQYRKALKAVSIPRKGE